ncbi:MAG: phosphoadenylyl-sulfate reductase [Cellvibrionaceae bacterium]|nr:phosphoadenylyl-sulfate reductase [Cellvibrionaceae bacterium]
MTNKIDLVDLDSKLQQEPPQAILEQALSQNQNIALSFSGAEDVVLVDMASKISADIQVFCLDTGRLHRETYEYLEKVRQHYDLTLEILFPEAEAVSKLVSEKGLFSFYNDNHQECCGVRKVGPLRKKLLQLDAWVTGQRRDQSPGTRAAIPVVQLDRSFARPGATLLKYNPLANWSSQQVWGYIRSHNVPYNPLHDRGFASIGCAPCTKSIGPGQHEREGRWWWEEATKKECGLHATNIDK